MTLSPAAVADGPDLVLSRARLLDLATGRVGRPQDLHITAGRVSRRPADGAVEQIDLDGGIVMPGLWDAHVHLGQWALRSRWVDLSGARSAAECLALLREALSRDADPTDVVVGHGYRATLWSDAPSEAAMDEMAGERAVVAISGDLHSAWASRAALRRFGLDHKSGLLTENEAFDLQLRVTQLDDLTLDALVHEAGEAAAASGLVGVVDVEMTDGVPVWQRRFAHGFDSLVVRTAIYPEWLDLTARRGLATGDLLDDEGLLAVGPLKVITDGALTSGTAWCHEPYAASIPGATDPRGQSAVSHDDLVHLMARATAQGLECAVHAIGDAAVTSALDAFETTGCHGSIEHAQLVRPRDIRRMAQLGLRASVQPAHLLDDRAALDALWADRAGDAFPLASMVKAGVHLALGSDAPVSPVDPWLAIEAAVRRAAGADEPWHPEQRLTVSQALLASCRGVSSLVAGAEADLVVLADNPFDLDQGQLHTVRPVMTMLGGRRTHG